MKCVILPYMGDHYAPHTFVSTSQVLPNFMLMTVYSNRFTYSPHLTGEETEVLRHEVTSPRSHI